jgi:hypothetical protein
MSVVHDTRGSGLLLEFVWAERPQAATEFRPSKVDEMVGLNRPVAGLAAL